MSNTNPTITIHKFNGNIKCNYRDIMEIIFQHLGATDECDVHIGVPYLEYVCNDQYIPSSGGTIYPPPAVSKMTYAPTSKTISHGELKSCRAICKTEIMNYIEHIMGKNITTICPGFSIIMDRLIEEYYNAFILLQPEKKEEEKEERNEA